MLMPTGGGQAFDKVLEKKLTALYIKGFAGYAVDTGWHCKFIGSVFFK
jgi:hypothetical protein